MSTLHYEHADLYMESVCLKEIAEHFGTPCYVYSRTTIAANWRSFDQAFQRIPHQICYAVKANSNIAILHLLAKIGSGFDIVSVGELERVLKAQGDVTKIIFSGVGKTENEIERAIAANIFCFNVESAPELERLNAIASRLNKKINIALRINPDVDAQTHTYIATGLKENKFGIERSEVIPLCARLAEWKSLNLIGIACHIGSQLVELKPFVLALERLLDIYKQLEQMNLQIKYLNIGGGLGIHYRDEQPPTISEYAHALIEKLAQVPVELILEPGRAIVANAGVLLTRVEYLKHNDYKNFAIVDAGMNDLLRPALYEAWQDIIPVTRRDQPTKAYDIAGPVCESADFIGKERKLALAPGDILAVTTAGAYGFSMSSNYNSRCRPAEVLVHEDKFELIRRRETIEELFAAEKINE